MMPKEHNALDLTKNSIKGHQMHAVSQNYHISLAMNDMISQISLV